MPKIVAPVIALLVVGVLGVAAAKPDAFRIQRTASWSGRTSRPVSRT